MNPSVDSSVCKVTMLYKGHQCFYSNKSVSPHSFIEQLVCFVLRLYAILVVFKGILMFLEWYKIEVWHLNIFLVAFCTGRLYKLEGSQREEQSRSLRPGSLIWGKFKRRVNVLLGQMITKAPLCLEMDCGSWQWLLAIDIPESCWKWFAESISRVPTQESISGEIFH